ncbi:MAG: 2-amino-4-hydroxy-6-hydroxymethyldihydropteridine diphosphokinase [Bacteroidetes bacterium]|nr:MAG: 2-amino-4-hydroxy-6-hydroxymethyldihydropteridine diphosphokinase [Bacteroidota bacterium]TAG86380.1 MAG: 2-amino-4-hydroxy-6-hydroxymethyldihydropteridine diphosphokinase [Bacteroidota bacterium]
MTNIYLLLGTNIGNLSENLANARQLLTKNNITILKQSKLYQTKPWGVLDQPDFLNQVIEIETDFLPFELLDFTQNIEKKMGRIKLRKWGERIIDIDILAFDDVIIEHEKLTLPHPHAHTRDFTLIPWAEIAPDFVHIQLQKTILSLLQELT